MNLAHSIIVLVISLLAALVWGSVAADADEGTVWEYICLLVMLCLILVATVSACIMVHNIWVLTA